MKLNKTIEEKLGKFVDVKNAPSRHVRGGTLSNQFILTFENGSVFKSYNTFIAVIINTPAGKALYLNPNKRVKKANGNSVNAYSATTNRACIDFCGLNTADRREAIKNGKFNYANNGSSYTSVVEVDLNK